MLFRSPVDKTGNFDGAEEYVPQERTAADILSADDGDDDGLGY